MPASAPFPSSTFTASAPLSRLARVTICRRVAMAPDREGSVSPCAPGAAAEVCAVEHCTAQCSAVFLRCRSW
eukprot:scaffold7340_cov266-Pinguiococcus_pyrenoidosus.AAC.50